MMAIRLRAKECGVGCQRPRPLKTTTMTIATWMGKWRWVGGVRFASQGPPGAPAQKPPLAARERRPAGERVLTILVYWVVV